MNSIDAKGYNFLQQNSPGNDGYGQIGLKGETGEDGNSVYFTPYILSLSSNVGISSESRYIMFAKQYFKILTLSLYIYFKCS